MKSPTNHALEFWRSSAVEHAKELGLDLVELSGDLLDNFGDSLVRWYTEPVREAMSHMANKEGKTDSEIARRYGVHRAQVKRWIDRQSPGLRSFCVAAAAENTRYEDGVCAAADSYAAAYKWLTEKTQPKESRGTLLREEVLCLYFTTRSVRWLNGVLDHNLATLQEASKRISEAVAIHLGDETHAFLGVEEIRRVMKRAHRTWIILEAAIRRDWYVGL